MSMVRNKYEEKYIYLTLRGELVLSRAEVIIANILHGMSVEYEYEKQFKGIDGRIVYPDFTIPYKGGEILIEYLGMMSDREHREKTKLKYEWYRSQGVRFADNYNPRGKEGNILITITETKEGGLDSQQIKNGLMDFFIKIDSSLLRNNEGIENTRIVMKELLGFNRTDEEVELRRQIRELNDVLTKMNIHRVISAVEQGIIPVKALIGLPKYQLFCLYREKLRRLEMAKA
jgi:hypothetical protein